MAAPELIVTPKFTLPAQLSWLLIFIQVFNVGLLYFELSLWVIAVIVLCLLWRLLVVLDEKYQPSHWTIVIIALAGCVMLLVSSKQLGLLSTMLHLLCLAYGLKTLELKSRKDFYQLSLLGFFVLTSSLIFYQSLYFSFLLSILLIINVTALLMYFTGKTSILTLFKTASKLMLQSLPLAIVLFVVFPKLAPLWHVPAAKSSTTGISNSVKIGDIANLALSDALAFRVEFDNNAPDANQLYWRTLVLESFDGATWEQSLAQKQIKKILLGSNKQRVFTFEDVNSQGANTQVKNNQAKNSQAFSYQGISYQAFSYQGINYQGINYQAFNYQVIAEPSFQHWLFALDIAQVDNTRQIMSLPDYTLFSRQVLSQTVSYKVTSYQQPLLDNITNKQETLLNQHLKNNKVRNLEFPAESNPRLTKQGQLLRQEFPDKRQLIQAVLNNYRQKPFRYTLQPPPLINNSLDQFYFETQAGFCEYYASSFTYLMRAAGIPARMVVGYLGGEYNPRGKYYGIYQRDAHAWSEVWLDSIGWVRIDPTAAVHPARVEGGLPNDLLQQQSLLSGNFLSLYRLRQFALINNLRLQFQAIDYQWTRWVIGYTAKNQFKLLSGWFGNLRPYKIALLVAFTFVSIMFLLWLVNRERLKIAPKPVWLVLYFQALVLIAKKGLEKPKGMGIWEFSKLFSRWFSERFSDPKEGEFSSVVQSFAIVSKIVISIEYQKLSEQEHQQALLNLRAEMTNFKQEIKKLKFNKSFKV